MNPFRSPLAVAVAGLMLSTTTQVAQADTSGPHTDRTFLSYTNPAGVTSRYHLYAAGLDWGKPVGFLIYTDGSGEWGLKHPGDDYLLGGEDGLVAVAKRHNMVLLTPFAPGKGCPDGEGVCWYEKSSGLTPTQKVAWSFDLVQKVKDQYPLSSSRVVFGGYSSGAQWTTQFFGPAYGSRVMAAGAAVAISYGQPPKAKPTFTTSHKANVAYVWDVGSEDEAVEYAREGYDWYRSHGFAHTSFTVNEGMTHDRDGTFGGVIDRAIRSYVTP